MSELESVVTDSELTRILTESRELNVRIKDMPLSVLESAMKVERLNREWKQRGFYDKDMFVTGQVYFGGTYDGVQDIHPKPEAQHKFVDAGFTSKGFSILNIVDEIDGVMQQDQKLVMWGIMRFENEKSPGGMYVQNCGIVIDDEVYIECREMTPGKANAWLDTYHPDIKFSIDNALMNADNEAEATTLLQNLELPIESKKKKTLKELIENLELYLNHFNQYEAFIPYLTELIGDCTVLDEKSGGYYESSIATSYKTPLLIKGLSVRHNEDKTSLNIWLHGKIIERDKRSSKQVIMPIETIHKIDSGREILKLF